MPDYRKTCSFLHAHYTETLKVVEKVVKNSHIFPANFNKCICMQNLIKKSMMRLKSFEHFHEKASIGQNDAAGQSLVTI